MGTKSRFHLYLQDVHHEVTGSCHHQNTVFPNEEKSGIVVDYGMFQGEEKSDLYNEITPFDPSLLDFSLITHNHIDHTGRLPVLSKMGFAGTYYATDATKTLLPYALGDSYKVLSGKSKKDHKPMLYTDNQIEQVLRKVEGVKYNQPIKIGEHYTVTFLGNGHLPGAASILVQVHCPGEEPINMLYSGDYHYKNMFFTVPKIPEWVKKLPLNIVLESTYGDMTTSQVVPCFEENVMRAMQSNKALICPVFSLGRAQEVLYVLRKMQDDGRLAPWIPIYYDGKLSFKYTALFLTNQLGLDPDKVDFLPKNLFYVDKKERAKILAQNGPMIVLTTSGMGTHGPASTYIPAFISRPNATIHFTGYVAEGTVGRKLMNTEKGEVIQGVYGQNNLVRYADVLYTSEFSAHAKQDELLAFLRQFSCIKAVLLNHGSSRAKQVLATKIEEEIDAKEVAILDREHMFCIGPWGIEKRLTSKFAT